MIRFERTAQILTAVKNNPDQTITRTCRKLHMGLSNIRPAMKTMLEWKLIEVEQADKKSAKNVRITRKGMEWLTTWNTLKELMKEQPMTSVSSGKCRESGLKRRNRDGFET
jgi:predicted transcriptional regulator